MLIPIHSDDDPEVKNKAVFDVCFKVIFEIDDLGRYYDDGFGTFQGSTDAELVTWFSKFIPPSGDGDGNLAARFLAFLWDMEEMDFDTLHSLSVRLETQNV